MNVLIVYDSQFGNTERLVRVIAGRLGSARLMRAEEAGALARPECDLLIVAGPTQRRRASLLTPTKSGCWATDKNA